RPWSSWRNGIMGAGIGSKCPRCNEPAQPRVERTVIMNPDKAGNVEKEAFISGRKETRQATWRTPMEEVAE
ncbi:MAG: hypothetical protein JW854_00275, partial [Actinobacteria bacterium]|nr:hypothetical protein [Actinomycetota bacterium]